MVVLTVPRVKSHWALNEGQGCSSMLTAQSPLHEHLGVGLGFWIGGGHKSDLLLFLLSRADCRPRPKCHKIPLDKNTAGNFPKDK